MYRKKIKPIIEREGKGKTIAGMTIECRLFGVLLVRKVLVYPPKEMKEYQFIYRF